jgi:hypothetical protein
VLAEIAEKLDAWAIDQDLRAGASERFLQLPAKYRVDLEQFV